MCKPPKSWEEFIGYCEGETCYRNGCKGIIQYNRVGDGCSCHINPPCSYCVDTNPYCETCGWEYEDEQNNETFVIQTEKVALLETKSPVYDPRPIYEVQRFFDDIYEATVKRNLSEQEAREYAYKCATAKERHYVTFGVRKMKFTFLEWIQKIA